MLEQLTIRDLALLKRTELAPSAGLTVISGETGGGKTLVVTAMRLLRGDKGEGKLVRAGAKAASVDGVFRLSQGERSERVRQIYEEVLGTSADGDRIVVSRVVEAAGRSRALVDGRPVTMAALQRLGEHLIEIHTQGSHRSLMRAEIQTELCDAYAGLTEDRHRFATLLREARALDERRRRLRDAARERRERVEYLRYCVGDIDAVAPRRGEHAELAAKAKVLANLDRLRQVLDHGVQVLQEGDVPEMAEPIVKVVGGLARDVEDLTSSDPRLGEAARLLGEATLLLKESARELQGGLGRLDLDPAHAEEVGRRLSELDRLLERFGPGEEELFTARAAMANELAELEDGAQTPEALEAELARRCDELTGLGAFLTERRTEAAHRLSRTLAAELAGLHMERIAIDVRVTPKEGASLLESASDLGTSEVEIFLAPNPGEPMAALRATASGGEVARVMLVLKKILADADRVPVLVFDEADAEIGGRLGFAVGRKLKEVSRSHQVLCVTHLPQIAAFADEHFLVAKRVERAAEGERTVADVRLLPPADRKRELASMARGETVDANALVEAGRLLKLARDAVPGGGAE